MGSGARGRLAALMLVLAFVASGCDWTMWRYGAGHTGFARFEHAIGASNAPTLQLKWAATGVGSYGTPAIANGVLYTFGMDAKLYAFDARGGAGCSGSPLMCSPLWSARASSTRVDTAPAVVDGRVYVSGDDGVYVFDAAGSTGCSGVPKTCAPLWRAPTFGRVESPTVADGVVYVQSRDTKTLAAFDAAGVTNCSGSPKLCVPLWTATTGTSPAGYAPLDTLSPAVLDGVVYTSSADGTLSAFDARGSTHCGGAPKTCTPLWTGAAGPNNESSPAVLDGVVYVGSTAGRLYAFDATGTTGCSGTPKTCTPLWRSGDSYATISPTVTDDYVFVVGSGKGANSFDLLSAFFTDTTRRCSGSPPVCTPSWSREYTGVAGVRPMTAANGLVYASGAVGLGISGGGVAALTDGNGDVVWGVPLTSGPYTTPVIANGWVYAYRNGALEAYGLPE